jgi:hypothetical protein
MTADRPFPSSVELVLGGHAPLVDTRAARPLALEAAVAAMAPATKAAITADLKCFLAWCKARRPVATAVPAEPETLVHYLHWLAKGSDIRPVQSLPRSRAGSPRSRGSTASSVLARRNRCRPRPGWFATR